MPKGIYKRSSVHVPRRGAVYIDSSTNKKYRSAEKRFEALQKANKEALQEAQDALETKKLVPYLE